MPDFTIYHQTNNNMAITSNGRASTGPKISEANEYNQHMTKQSMEHMVCRSGFVIVSLELLFIRY